MPRFMARPLAFLGLTALLVSAASAMITLLLAIALVLRGSSISPLALAAGIVDVLGLGWIAYLLAGITAKDPRGRRRRTIPSIALVPSMLLSSSAASLTFATLIWIHIQPAETKNTIFGDTLYTLNKVDYGLWGGSVLIQSLFVGLCFHEPSAKLPEETVTVRQASTPQDILDAMPPPQTQPREPSPPLQLQTIVPPIPPYNRSIVSSRSNETFSSEGKSSYRSSFHGTVRPMSSRTQLIRQNSWAHPSSSTTWHSSSQKMVQRPKSGSRNSSIDQGTCEGLTPPKTPVKERLSTIPGSRANSPARPLDGPFPDQPLPEHSEQTEEREYVAEKERMGQSRRSSRSLSIVVRDGEVPVDSPVDESRVPPRFRAEPTNSHPSSPTIDESYIHPLFRTDSPHPAPIVTPGTTVVASAFGGQAMTPRTLTRATSRSRPTSSDGNRPAMPVRTRSHSRPTNRFEKQPMTAPAMIRSKSMETMQTRMAMREISGNAPPLPLATDVHRAKPDLESPASDIAIYVDAES